MLTTNIPEHDTCDVALHPLRVTSHHVAQTLQCPLCVGKITLTDDSSEEPGEGAPLIVSSDLLHCGRAGQTWIWPDTCPVVNKDTCQLNTFIKITDTERQKTSTL